MKVCEVSNIKVNSICDLFEVIIQCIPEPTIDLDSPLQMLVTNMDYNELLKAIDKGGLRQRKCSETLFSLRGSLILFLIVHKIRTLYYLSIKKFGGISIIEIFNLSVNALVVKALTNLKEKWWSNEDKWYRGNYNFVFLLGKACLN